MPASSVMQLEQLPILGKSVGRHDMTVLLWDIAYTQATLTDIRQKFLHVISTDNCSVGRSGNCRLVTTVYSEFINLQSKSKFTRVGMSESSN